MIERLSKDKASVGSHALLHNVMCDNTMLRLDSSLATEPDYLHHIYYG